MNTDEYKKEILAYKALIVVTSHLGMETETRVYHKSNGVIGLSICMVSFSVHHQYVSTVIFSNIQESRP